METSEKKKLVQLLRDVHAYYRQDVTPFLLDVWTAASEQFTFDQVDTALKRHMADPDRGSFVPRVSDMVRILEGTYTDRALLAWGKTLEAMRCVGANQDVVFDDPAIHACVEDLGGWPKLCRTAVDELQFAQKRFCDSHKAYAGRGVFEYQRSLVGDRSPDYEYVKKGLKPPKPVAIGDPVICRQVYRAGSGTGKTTITFPNAATLALEGVARRINAPDPKSATTEKTE